MDQPTQELHVGSTQSRRVVGRPAFRRSARRRGSPAVSRVRAGERGESDRNSLRRIRRRSRSVASFVQWRQAPDSVARRSRWVGPDGLRADVVGEGRAGWTGWRGCRAAMPIRSRWRPTPRSERQPAGCGLRLQIQGGDRPAPVDERPVWELLTTSSRVAKRTRSSARLRRARALPRRSVHGHHPLGRRRARLVGQPLRPYLHAIRTRVNAAIDMRLAGLMVALACRRWPALGVVPHRWIRPVLVPAAGRLRLGRL
jgi:hypothetical protein